MDRSPAPDVVVVGGGIVGVSAAAFLAEGGAAVTLVEASGIAAGASGRNSGVVQHPFDSVLREIHLDTLAIYRSLAEVNEVGFALPSEPAGLLMVSRAPDGLADLAAELAIRWPELGPEYLDGATLQRLEPGLAPDVSACRLRIGYPVPPDLGTHALASLAERRGARHLVGRAAKGLIRHGSQVIGVELEDGATIPASAVLVAAGSASPGILDPRGRWRPIRPVWGVVVEIGLDEPPRHVLEEAEMDEALGEVALARAVDGATSDGATSGSATSDADSPPSDRGEPGGGAAFSLVTAGGRSSLGSTFLETRPDEAAWVPRLVAHGRRFVPAIADARLGRVRSCARPVAIDGRPLLGPVPGMPGAFIAAGHGPWGISTGPGSARVVADAILGRPSAIPAELDAGRFGPIG
jgi:glycine/D-amino acid oxidase-like deaminating enzyme